MVRLHFTYPSRIPWSMVTTQLQENVILSIIRNREIHYVKFKKPSHNRNECSMFRFQYHIQGRY
jgi:hypothetical protein